MHGIGWRGLLPPYDRSRVIATFIGHTRTVQSDVETMVCSLSLSFIPEGQDSHQQIDSKCKCIGEDDDQVAFENTIPNP